MLIYNIVIARHKKVTVRLSIVTYRYLDIYRDQSVYLICPAFCKGTRRHNLPVGYPRVIALYPRILYQYIPDFR